MSTAKAREEGYPENVDIDFKFQRIVQQKVVTPKFYKKVWGIVIEVDTRSDELGKMFDLDAGIDKVVKGGGQIFGLAQRIQRKRYATMETITWRATRSYRDKSYLYKSEWFKIQKMMQARGLAASYQSHCYVNADDESATDIIHGIIFNRFGLMGWLSQYPGIIKRRPTRPDRRSGQIQTFYYIKFNEVPSDYVIARYEDGHLVPIDQYHRPVNLMPVQLEMFEQDEGF